MTKAITKNSKKGFTLVELVIVIAILAILAAIAIPVVNSIINTASKNGALSNAETIELSIKECQADIAARNNEVYNGTSKYSFTQPNGTATVTDRVLPNAASGDATARKGYKSIDVQDVAGAKGIADAFKTVTYDGVDYKPYWDQSTDKCVFIGEVSGKNHDLSTGAEYVGGSILPLVGDDGNIVTTTILTIDTATATPSTP